MALWFEEAKKYNVLPLNDLLDHRRRTSRRSWRWSSTSRCRRAASTPTTRARTRDPGALGGQHARRVVQGPRRGRADRRRAGRDLRPRLPLRRPRAVHQGRHSSTTSTTSSASRRSRRITAPAPASGHAHHRRRVHEGADGRAPRVARPAEALRRRRGRGRERDPHDARPLLALRRGPLHRLRQRRRGQQRVHRPKFEFTGGRISRSSSTSPTTPMSTSNSTCRRRWPEIERHIARKIACPR